MPKAKIPFIEGELVFRNTWKSPGGNIRVNIYSTWDRASASARNNKGALYQEVATPVRAEQCLQNFYQPAESKDII